MQLQPKKDPNHKHSTSEILYGHSVLFNMINVGKKIVRGIAYLADNKSTSKTTSPN
jgi:hypothetical protein